jgi:hypothetical protein
MFKRCLSMIVLGLVVAWVPSCVELCGQRIAWHYDATSDELRVILCYDGIHESSEGLAKGEKGAEQIPQFVTNGDVMLLDWVGHFGLAEWRQQAGVPEATPQDLELGEIARAVTAAPIGYYREPDGRVGAAQYVVIRKPHDVIKWINKLINDMVLEMEPDDALARTHAAMKAAAAKGHAWLGLEDQSLRVTVPIDPTEWRAVKGQFLRELVAGVISEERGTAESDERIATMLVTAAGSVPLSYIESQDRATFVLTGGKGQVLRLPYREKYEPSLEPVVAQAVGTSLDARLTAGEDPSPTVAALLEWGPPEMRVGAWLSVTAQEETRRPAAVQALVSWRQSWNRLNRYPPAPEPAADELAAWRRWYESVRSLPRMGH